jgi:hypothetical protein
MRCSARPIHSGTDYSLVAFRPLLDGTTNWPAVMEELDQRPRIRWTECSAGWPEQFSCAGSAFSELAETIRGLRFRFVVTSGALPHPPCQGVWPLCSLRRSRRTDTWPSAMQLSSCQAS